MVRIKTGLRSPQNDYHHTGLPVSI